MDIVNRQAISSQMIIMSYCACTNNHNPSTRTGKTCTSHKPKTKLILVLCEHSPSSPLDIMQIQKKLETKT